MEAFKQVTTDTLTTLKTLFFSKEKEAVRRELDTSTRAGCPFSVVMMDLDHFKRLDDRVGLLEGDRVLVAVADLIRAESDHSYIPARCGADEFAILLPETDTKRAVLLAERLRTALEADHFLHSHAVTASFGIATFPVHASTAEEILRVADSGVFRARLRKGNRVELGSLDGRSGRHDESYDDILNRHVESEGLALLADPYEVIEGSMNLADSPQMRCHRRGVTWVAVRISQQLNLSVEEAAEIRQAAALHEFGKAAIPATILYKPKPLTAEECAVMRTHPVKGEQNLKFSWGAFCRSCDITTSVMAGMVTRTV